jgi:hypothetical protein
MDDLSLQRLELREKKPILRGRTVWDMIVHSFHMRMIDRLRETGDDLDATKRKSTHEWVFDDECEEGSGAMHL